MSWNSICTICHKGMHDMNYDEAFRKKFDYSRKYASARELEYKLGQYRENRNNREFVFVEGSTDAMFYKNTSISLLADKTAYIYASYNPDKDAEKGKKAIYKAYESICRNEDLRYELDRCIFIIDRDYEYYPEDRIFTVTEGHSMEDYFFELENIKVVFSFFNLSEDDALKFWNLFKDFANKCYEFYALKGTWTYMMEEKRKNGAYISKWYNTKNKYVQIFVFSFNKESYLFCEDKLIEETSILRDVINFNERFIPYYQKLYDDIKGNPMMIRGHDAYEFLKQYLLQVHSITISDDLREIVPAIKDLGIELDIKQIPLI